MTLLMSVQLGKGELCEFYGIWYMDGREEESLGEGGRGEGG